MIEPVTGFRTATRADIDAIVTLVESAYRGDSSRRGWTTEADLLEGQRTDAEDVGRTIDADNGVVILAERNDLLVGCCHVERRPALLAHFGMFAVNPGLQGGGVGRALMSEAQRIAREEFGATTMDMSVIKQRTELIAWYERLGFVRTGATAPFPYGDARFGSPRRPDLEFVILAKPLVDVPAATDRG